MRYIDSGERDASQTLGSWLKSVLTPMVTEVRWQSGFFSAKGLGVFTATLERLAVEDGVVKVLIGSNEAVTLRDDVLQLVEMLGLPRRHAKLGVVRFPKGLFHTKTYHFRRSGRSQCAYIGSANLTHDGLSRHVEAGLILDTDDGDDDAHSLEVLDQIAKSVDRWFEDRRPGMSLVKDSTDVDQLVTDGVLQLTRRPRPTAPPLRHDGSGVLSPPLRSLVELPTMPTKTISPVASDSTPAIPTPIPAKGTSERLITLVELATTKSGSSDSMPGIAKKAGHIDEIRVGRIVVPFCWCPSTMPYKFKMGSPPTEAERLREREGQVDVELTRGFWLSQTVVTQELYDAVMGMSRSESKGAKRPKEVTWNDASAFCEKVSDLVKDQGYRVQLPTEAEWEYACRAGTTTPYSFDDPAKIGEYAWYNKNSKGPGEAKGHTHDVAKKKPNGWNLYDMHGNVWEWCRDWYVDVLTEGPDPEVTDKGESNCKVARGGNWKVLAGCCRSAYRFEAGKPSGPRCLGMRLRMSDVQSDSW